MMTAAIVILFVMAIIVAAWIVAEIKKRNTANYNEYENDYGQIKYLINNYKISDYSDKVNDLNYKRIQKRLAALSKMKYKNKEKTTILVMEFCRKFKCKI